MEGSEDGGEPRDKAAQSLAPSANLPSPKLLELLVCPLTKGSLVFDRAAHELISKSAGLAYPIREGIPILLASEAREL